MSDTYVQPLHLGVIFLMIELILVALVGIGLRAMMLGQEVIWECRWRWPHRLAAAYAYLREAELTRPATWQRIGQHGAAFLGSELPAYWAFVRSFTPAMAADLIRQKLSTVRGSRGLC